MSALAACSSDPTIAVDPATDTESSGHDASTSTGPHGTSLDGTTTRGTQTDAGETATGTTNNGTGSTSTSDGGISTSDGGTSTSDGGTSTSDGGTSTDTGEPVAVCGDGIVSDGEVCDEGGETATCNADCTVPSCGDGYVNALAGELCDDGGESPTCNVGCTPAACGDGIVNASAGELCDDSGRTAACNTDCTLASCGDGVLNVLAGEDCDDGGESAFCNLDCSLAGCGDGITNLSAGEDCDDAGTSAACDADCTAAACGDGVLNAFAGEACDGPALAGASCQTLGYPVGTLACGPGCGYDTSACVSLPPPPVLALAFSPIKRFDFTWAAVAGAEHYELLESASPGDPYLPLGGDLVGTSASFERSLHFRAHASYVLRACNVAGCSDSAPVSVVSTLAAAVGYFKASNTGPDDRFGVTLALSGDGNTMAMSSLFEDSAATGINGAQANEAAPEAGAAYVFARDATGQWVQQAYIKASNTGANDWFGQSLALSADGNTLAIGAVNEDSNATGIDGNQLDDLASSSGAVYVYVRDAAGQWSQQAYVKSSNSAPFDSFGTSVALSADGSTMAVSALGEDSGATGVGGNQGDNSAPVSGAVYVFLRSPLQVWSQQAYVKASNTGADDRFGQSVALSGDGNTLAVGADEEDSNATGIDGNQASEIAGQAGAAYVFVRDAAQVWSQQAYVKASNTGAADGFGFRLTLSGDGDTLAVGAWGEDSNATGVGGNQANNLALSAGAAYVFVRDAAQVWSQQAYVKASNSEGSDGFGRNLRLSGSGDVLGVGAFGEDGDSAGVDGDPLSNAVSGAGAVYVLMRSPAGAWSQVAYVKASNPGASDSFGTSLALAHDGSTLAVGGSNEDSVATGIGGNQADDTAAFSGAVYLY